MIHYLRQLAIGISFFSFLAPCSYGQNDATSSNERIAIDKTVSKPYKILSAGKKITIQSKNNIKRIFVWTSDGHRIVEQHDLNISSYSFTIPVNEKYFFLMVEMRDGKRYSEKFGVQ